MRLVEKKSTKFQHNFCRICKNTTYQNRTNKNRRNFIFVEFAQQGKHKGELDQHTFDYEFNVTQLKTKEWQNYLIHRYHQAIR